MQHSHGGNDENRTRITNLEGWCSAIKLRSLVSNFTTLSYVGGVRRPLVSEVGFEPTTSRL